MRIALYARVSTVDQTTANQLEELRRYAAARGWAEVSEFVDHGVSGAKSSRPALDDLMRAAQRRQIDAVVVWRLDRLGRNLKHLVTVIDTWQALGVAFISLNEGIDCTTPAGTLQLHILAALAQFERSRIAERVKAGLARTKAAGTVLGRREVPVNAAKVRSVEHLTVRAAAAALGVSKSQVQRWREAVAA